MHVRVGAKRTSLGKGERNSYCLYKYLCECGMEMNFESAGVFHTTDPCWFCELFVKGLHSG